jgi:hypothetical protein
MTVLCKHLRTPQLPNSAADEAQVTAPLQILGAESIPAPITAPPSLSTSVSTSSARGDISHRNTRLSATFLAQQRTGVTPSPLENSHTPTATATPSDADEEAGNDGKKYSFVAMTPSPAPSALGLSSPLVTWGDIAGTPLALDPSLADIGGSQQRFTMQDPPRRERLANALVLEVQQRKRSTAQPSSSGTPRARTAAETLSRLTPAAQALARKLHTPGRGEKWVSSASPFGGGLQQKQKRSKLPRDHDRGVSSNATSVVASSITDGLLKL